MAACSKENIYLFIKYLQRELPRQQEHKLDIHIQTCKNCLLNFAYIEEILRQKHKLSIDEQTLLLRYLSHPIYQNERDRLKQEILNDIRNIQKDEIKHQLLNQIKALSPISKDVSPTQPNPIPISSPNKLNIKSYKTFFFSKFVTAAFVFIFLGLSIINYSVISNNPDAFSLSSLYKLLNNTQNTSTNNVSLDTNLYQALDLAIDNYLQTQALTYIKNADSIAKDIESKYGDKYGVDLVVYYQSLPTSLIKPLLDCRRELTRLAKKPNGDLYSERLQSTQILLKQLESFGNIPELYKAKALEAKLQIRTRNYEESKKNIDSSLTFLSTKRYLILSGYFWVWKGNYLSEIGQLGEAEIAFNQALSLGKTLQVDELVISPSMSLAAFYHISDKNEQCLEIAQNALTKAVKYNNENTISLLQMGGISAFNQGFVELANYYLKDAIKLSKERNNPSYLSLSYSFLAITLSELKNFDEAEKMFLLAKASAEKIQEPDTRLDFLSRVLGYHAKAKLIEGKFDEAITFYKQTIQILEGLQVQQHQEMSQLHEGLALALEKTHLQTQAQEHYIIAKKHKNLATDDIKSNCLLAFVPTPCTNK